MAKRTRSKSFFVDRELREDASYERFEAEIREKFNKMEKKRKFCRTKPLKQVEQKFQVELVKLKNVCRLGKIVYRLTSIAHLIFIF